jgi:hypothetical protein
MMRGPCGEGSPGHGSRGETLAHEVPVPCPFTLESFSAAVERWRRRPLTMVAIRLPPGRHGLWVGTAGRDYILYEPSLPPLQQVRAIAHQAGHMCADHTGNDAAGNSVVTALFPSLDPGLVAAELPPPKAFTDAEEQEAEAFATALLARIVLPPETAWQRSGQSCQRDIT